MRRLSCALYKDHPKGVQSKTWNLVLLWSLAALLALVPNASAQELRAEEVLRLLARGPAKGSDHAPVTIIEFSDFQCTFCWRFWKQTLPRLEEEYIKAGKVRFIYTHLAILGPQSVAAAQASECAREQGKFWEYHDKLFASKGFFSLADRRLKQYARDLGLDGEAFDQCLDAGTHAKKVEGETGIGLALGARGTPTFFINGLKLVGAHPFQTFRSIIEDQLKTTLDFQR
ncbi:MAG: thioredoxin domain-containing protein [candidate division NC10 bacterium]|nr:thioredoxin domain-containing protein [candidate division NC10 bacterium]